MHVYGHGNACVRVFAPKRNVGEGLVDGEATERFWSRFAKYHNIVKEMGPVKRIEMLEDVMRDVRIGKRASYPPTIKLKHEKVVRTIKDLKQCFQLFGISHQAAKQLWIDEKDSFNSNKTTKDTSTEAGLRLTIQTLIIETAFHQKDMRSRSTPGFSSSLM